MATVRLKWSNLLKLTELDFQPDFPAELHISDEVLQVISWLTGTTGFDRRLLRCTKQGALLFAQPWSMMHQVAVEELGPAPTEPDITAALAANDGVLVVTSTQVIRADFKRVEGGDEEQIYIPPGNFLWYPFSCYTVEANTVPTATGTACFVGVTTFKA